ncbi:MAG: hypothetical protein OXQ90_03875 [Gammaproteobacteria bacterium]|nr:hypothetical protein [Gammaproteobacteria bacterium]
MALLSHWDETGGWGKYATRNRDDASWAISIENGFIERKNGKVFWEGYFRGFCEKSAKLLTDCEVGNPKVVNDISCSFDEAETLVCRIEWRT